MGFQGLAGFGGGGTGLAVSGLAGFSGIDGPNISTVYDDVVRNTSAVRAMSWQTSLTSLGDSLDGEAIFQTPGAHTWTCPSGVTSVSVVCIGGGGGGGMYGSGGGGGGLGYKTNYSVTAGTAYALYVGRGGAGGNSTSPGAGEESYFIGSSTVSGAGGGAGVEGQSDSYAAKANGGSGGSFNGNGGGAGGQGGGVPSRSNNWFAGGGGGAGGYSGTGGDGGNDGDGTAGSGGAAGGGAGDKDPTNNGYAIGGEGGGVFPFGEGSSGSGGTYLSATYSPKPGIEGHGGSGGYDGGNIFASDNPGYYGGGGAGGYTGAAHGIVRIVWPGSSKQFPNTNVGKSTSGFKSYLLWMWGNTYAFNHWHSDKITGLRGSKTQQVKADVWGWSEEDSNNRYFVLNDVYNGKFDWGVTYSQGNLDGSNDYDLIAMKEADSFMKIVEWTGNGSNNRSITHNCGFTPGFIMLFSDSRGTAYVHNYDGTITNWHSYRQDAVTTSNNTEYGTISAINDTSFTLTDGSTDDSQTNESSTYYRAFCFANSSTARVGTYTGGGSGDQNINLGFSNGVKFVLIKRLTGASDECPSVIATKSKGITSGSDRLLTTSNSFGSMGSVSDTLNLVKPLNSGFTVASPMQASGVDFVYFAISDT